MAQRLFRDRTDQREGVLTQRSSDKNHIYRRIRKLGSDVHCVRNDCQIAKAPHSSGDRSRGGARVKNEDLPLFDEARRCRRNMELLLVVKLLFLAQGRVFERALPGWEGAAMAAMQQPLLVQHFQVLTNRDLRGVELLGKVG